jgi:hypothetical protein
MAKYEAKTKPTGRSVEKFLNSVKDERRRRDCFKVLEMMKEVTKEEPKMWGPSIVGFGTYHYKYASGHEGDCCVTGFSPRKDALTVYLSCGFEGRDELMARLGKHKSGKACLYIKSLDDIDQAVLRRLIDKSVRQTKAMWKA